MEFRFCPQLVFESAEEREKIRERSKGATEKQLERGSRFSREIESSIFPSVSIQTVSEQCGLGLFAEEIIEEGAFSGEYTGLVRFDRGYYAELHNDYCFRYPIAGCLIDAREQGNLARFINHSERPNLQALFVHYDGLYHVIFLALRKICTGEELTFDYGPKYWNRTPAIDDSRSCP